MDLIYLDNAATTKAYKEIDEVISNFNQNLYFNPSALYKPSVDVFVEINSAREYIKQSLYAPDGDLIFLSGGSEADNTALFCTKKKKGCRIIVGGGEHDAINNSANQLLAQGYDVVFAPINLDGSVNIEEYTKLVTPQTELVSIMHVSNETGAVNDIARMVKILKRVAPKALFHSDGVQAFEKINVNLRALGVDLYSISGHKIHGPKGIGALFIKKGVSIKPLIYGGGQEGGYRSGTESTALIMALKKAVEINNARFSKNKEFTSRYISTLKTQLESTIPDVKFITPENGCGNILTLAFPKVRGEVLLHAVEKYGILCGIGSACSSHHESRFKKLLGLDDDHRDGIIRFSVSEFNDINEIDKVVKAVKSEWKTLADIGRI